MTAAWLGLLASASVAAHAPPVTRETPRATVREAVLAVEGDSVARVRARWAARLGTGDRDAALGVATLDRLTYRYADAARGYAALYGARSDDAPGRYALLGAATAAYASGFTARSDTLFDRARAAAHAARDSAAEAEALGGLAMDRANVLGAAVGLRMLDDARRIAPPADDALAAGLAVRRTVLMAVTFDKHAGAEGARALMLARRAGDRRTEGLALRAIALDQHLRTLDDSSLATLAAAERVERAARDRSTLAETLIRHADIYHARGDVGRFAATLEQAAAEAEASSNLYALGSAHIALGVIGLSVGDYETARTHLDEAVRRYTAQGDVAVMMARVFQADLALATGDLRTARALGTEVRDFHHRTGDVSEEFDALRALAAIERRAGRFDAAAAWLDTATALAHRRNRALEPDLDRDRGALAFARGDARGATVLLTRYVASLDTSDHVPRHAMRELLAAAAARAGDVAGAETELAAAGRELDAWRATLSSGTLRTLAFQVRGSDVDIDGGAAPAVIAAIAAHGRAAAAFELAERRRARALGDELVRARALASREDSARATAATTLTAAAAAARVVDDRTALLEYVAGSGGAPTTLFVVTRDGAGTVAVRAFAQPAADSLAPLVARLAGLLEAGTNPGPLAASLGGILAPALAALGPRVDHLVIVPDGALHRLPFDALRLADGRYLAERYVVSIAPSAVVAAELRGRVDAAAARPARPERLLAFGDPAFGDPAFGDATSGAARGARSAAPAASDAATIFRSAFDENGGLPRLAASGDEAREVARYAPEAVVRVGGDASAAYLRHAALASFDVIHFATHALVDERSLTRTALALAPGGGESGFVSPGDLAALHLDAGLVVLSACRSAGGMVVDGEGMQGLTAPLLEAGARSVVATRWRIGDRATVAFVADFYRALADRLPVADALRAARLAAIHRGAPAAEWAAFTVVGDPSARLPLRSPPARSRWLAAIAVLLLAPLGAFVAITRRRASRAPAAP